MELPRGADPGSSSSARVVAGAGVACGPSRGLAVLLDREPANGVQRSHAWRDAWEESGASLEEQTSGFAQPGRQEGASLIGALIESEPVPPAPAQPLVSDDEEAECPELEMVDSNMEDSDDGSSPMDSNYYTRQALARVVPFEAIRAQLSPAQGRTAAGAATVQHDAGRVQSSREGEDGDSDDDVPDLIEPVEQDERMHFDWPTLHIGSAPFPITSQSTAPTGHTRNIASLALQALSPRFLSTSEAPSFIDRQRTAQRRERRRRTRRQQAGESGGQEAQLTGALLGRLLTSGEERPRAVHLGGTGVAPPQLMESDDEEGVPSLVDGDSEDDEESVPELLEAQESWEGEESGSELGEEYADMPELLPGSAPSSEDEGDLGSPSRVAGQRRAMSDRLAMAGDDLRGDNFRLHGLQMLRNTFLGYPAADFVADNQLEGVLAMLREQSSFPWPPPASRAAVAALERVTITAAEEDDCCAVCRSSYVVGTEVLRMPCRHLFHADCLHPWLDVRNTCPLCRFQLPTDNAATSAEGAPPLLLSLEA